MLEMVFICTALGLLVLLVLRKVCEPGYFTPLPPLPEENEADARGEQRYLNGWVKPEQSSEEPLDIDAIIQEMRFETPEEEGEEEPPEIEPPPWLKLETQADRRAWQNARREISKVGANREPQ